MTINLTQAQVDSLRALDAALTQTWRAARDPYQDVLLIAGTRGVVSIDPCGKWGFDLPGNAASSLADDMVSLRNGFAQLLAAIV